MKESSSFNRSQGVIATRPFHDYITRGHLSRPRDEKNSGIDNSEQTSTVAMAEIPAPTQRIGATKG